ncbi:nucleobase:cation symporter-2 family protein [Endozoicomonas sp.]|uniref:nucleobase:cation symporter-2 family protein n=1 Tax=Endozoicomonas sp. TaxID=1892382 RepID=UPI002886A8E8|nr:nucleobase:cation symporter-2 family protein [Endozoicomonas sp.]
MKSFYDIEDRPPLGTSLVLALQHMLAAFGAIIAVPLVVGGVLGLSESTMVSIVSAALLVSGLVTMVQCLGLGPVGIRMPCVMGTSFTFVAVAIAIGQEHGLSGILGSALGGSLVMIIGSQFMGQVRKLFPPIVSGTVILMIGVSLVPVGTDWFAGALPGSADYGALPHLMIGLIVAVVVITLNRKGSGLFKTGAIVIGMAVGYLLSMLMGDVDFAPISQAAAIRIPRLLPVELTFPITGVISMGIIYLVTIMESTGDFLALSEVSHCKLTGKRLSRGILCDGIGSALASLFGTTPFSSFSQNVGIVAITGVASRFVVAMTGGLLMIAGFFPKLAALIITVPQPVLGGASIVMFGMIIAAGVKMLSRIDLDERNSIIVGVSITAGLAVTTRPDILEYLPSFFQVSLSSGIATAALVAVMLNQLFGHEATDSDMDDETEEEVITTKAQPLNTGLVS